MYMHDELTGYRTGPTKDAESANTEAHIDNNGCLVVTGNKIWPGSKDWDGLKYTLQFNKAETQAIVNLFNQGGDAMH